MHPRRVLRVANRDPKVIEQSGRHGRLRPRLSAKPPGAWEVGYFARESQVALVIVDDAHAEVRESWTGHQVAWQMARGYEGSFGHVLNAPYVWLPLCAVFLLGLLDWRRPWRLVHLDLAMLLGFGASHYFFNRAEIGVSVPLVYPVLVYLLARLLWVGFRGAGEGLRPSVPGIWLAAATVFLLAFRITINVADSGVIDVGYSGVIGADRITHGEALYGDGAFPDDNPTGDTYGPANYFAYVPVELALPWSGEWDELPAGHAAAILFDLVAVAGLFMLGRRFRGGREGMWLGVTLAFAWVAYPYTAYVLQANANDSLVAALLVWAFVAFASPLARGALLALAAATKFAPLALAPLFAAGERGFAERPRLRPALAFAAASAVVIGLTLAHPAVDPGLATFWDRTVESQLDRDSPFSIWGQEDELDWLQTAVRLGAVALALAVAFLPRERSLPQVAALAGAVLVAVQLAADHWFYLYVVWFFPLVIVALLNWEPAAAPARSSPPGRPA
jgi:hypothetical protein